MMGKKGLGGVSHTSHVKTRSKISKNPWHEHNLRLIFQNMAAKERVLGDLYRFGGLAFRPETTK